MMDLSTWWLNKKNVSFVPRLDFFWNGVYFNAKMNERKFSMLSTFFLHMPRVTHMVVRIKQWRRCYREQIDTSPKVILHPNLGVELLTWVEEEAASLQQTHMRIRVQSEKKFVLEHLNKCWLCDFSFVLSSCCWFWPIDKENHHHGEDDEATNSR